MAALGPANTLRPLTTPGRSHYTDGVFTTSQTSHSRSLSWTAPGTKTLYVTLQNAAERVRLANQAIQKFLTILAKPVIITGLFYDSLLTLKEYYE